MHIPGSIPDMDKRILMLVTILILIVVGLFIVRNIGANVTGKVVDEGGVENLREVSLFIEGMYCDACALGVEAQIEELDGVINAKVNAFEGSGVVRYDANKVDAETIAEASTVYPASVVSDVAK
jgi:copper chaperone CopZ